MYNKIKRNSDAHSRLGHALWMAHNFCFIFINIGRWRTTSCRRTGKTLQAYLIQGLVWWNIQRGQDGTLSADDDSGVHRSFDNSLMHHLNSLSGDVHDQPSLSSFSTPPAFTGELIGMEYLRPRKSMKIQYHAIYYNPVSYNVLLFAAIKVGWS